MCYNSSKFFSGGIGITYLSVDDFKGAVRSESLEAIVRNHIIGEEIPYVFRKQPQLFSILREHLSEAMQVSTNNIIVVGSAKMGFSLNPDNFPRRFSDTSDIDIAVISEQLFDKVWMTILEWNYPMRLKMRSHSNEGVWASKRRKDIYWGWFKPDDIRYDGLSFPKVLEPLRDISTEWFNAFQSLSLHDEFAARTVTGRLYRTLHHARRYHIEGLSLIRKKLETEGG